MMTWLIHPLGMKFFTLVEDQTGEFEPYADFLTKYVFGPDLDRLIAWGHDIKMSDLPFSQTRGVLTQVRFYKFSRMSDEQWNIMGPDLARKFYYFFLRTASADETIKFQDRWVKQRWGQL